MDPQPPGKIGRLWAMGQHAFGVPVLAAATLRLLLGAKFLLAGLLLRR